MSVIVRYLKDLIGGALDVAWGNGQSRRLLLARDNMGFALTDTIVNAGTSSTMQYTKHLMSAYVISGTGRLEAGGKVHPLEPGALYALDQHDRYTLHADTELRVFCVFNPPIDGDERHNLNADKPSAY